ncbi:hypothetical protein ABG067_004345 [Albugo candida]
MQLRHITSLLPATEGMCKVTSIAFSPNNRRLAVVTVDRVVHMFDAQSGERKDKFSTKASEKGGKTYVVRALAFSPDSAKLAVAQSDNIVFIYKIGLDWNDKKSICNKFPQNASVTCMTWPSAHPNEVIFGLADGKVRVGQLRSNKTATLYSTGYYTVALSTNVEGNGAVSAHADHSIYRFLFDDVAGGGASHIKIITHTCIPYALAWGSHIIAAGSDRKVVFYDKEGDKIQGFDYSTDDACGEFTVSVVNPTGDAVVVGNFNCFYTFSQSKSHVWDLVSIKHIENLYTITSLAWKNDGSRLAIGSLCGAMDLYDACVRRYRYKGAFEFTYVSQSQVIVKKLANNARMVIRSAFGCEIVKLNVFQDRFLVGNTSNTLIVGDLQTEQLSEVQWQSTGAEKCIVENENVCIVYQAGELTLIEYGRNEVLGCVRTEHLNPHLLSIRINERPSLEEVMNQRSKHLERVTAMTNKKIAYLLDLQTICIKDLHSHTSATVNHDCRIDWLELNGRGNLLLFRDKRRQLHLFDAEAQHRVTLLNYCNYVQWVPDSDVVVAQNRSNLSVWYNIRAPDKATIYQIKGDIEQIERANGRTEVIVDEGMNTTTYQLDEALIAFGTAMDDLQLVQAMSILDPLAVTAETQAMWGQLCEEALKQNDHRIAERCAAALGDISRSRYLSKVNKIDFTERNRLDEGFVHWKVRSKLALLKNDYRSAEHVLLSQGQLEETIEMYQHLHKWEDAIRVAEAKGFAGTDQMKRNYYEHLLQTRQEEKIALLKVKEGDYASAVTLYLKGGLPAKAAQLLQQRNIGREHKQVLETVAEALYVAGMYEKAGDQYERMEQESRALASYLKANAFRKAVDLARKHFPDKVIRLEEAWGDFLVSQKQMDMAINHYIEGNVPTKAVEAALNSRQWAKAGQLIETLEEDVALPYYRRLARHYQDAQNYELAERCFIKADAARDAVEMYTRVNKWDAAYQIAVNHMDKYETERLYVEQAHRMERQGMYKEAEKLFLTVNEPDLAINMYKTQKNYEQMIRLVTKYRKELLKDTHLYLAQQLEHENNLKEAEHHFTEAGEWQAAVNMYRSNDLWEEAIRVAKFHGGVNASKRVAFAWAMDLGGEQGSKLLTRLGLIEAAIDYAIETSAFDHAFELARGNCQKKLADVHFKHALFLEDEERFKEAEQEFLKAGKPREALDMYIHQQDWENAMRIAENADPASVPDVFIAQARVFVEQNDFRQAESLFIRGHKPELALAVYMEAKLWSDALGIAQRYLPHKIAEVNSAHQKLILSGGPKQKEELVEAFEIWVSCEQYVQAIDAYLSVQLEHLNNNEAVEELWARGVELCGKYDRGRYKTVVEEIASRLFRMSRFDSAAAYYKSINKVQEALDCYLRTYNWIAAQTLCEQHAPELLPRLERAQQASAFGSKSVESKVTAETTKAMEKKESKQSFSDENAPSSALEAWIQRGEWDKVLTAASKHGPKALATYLELRCTRLIELDDVDTGVTVFAEYGIPVEDASIRACEQVIRKCLGCNQGRERQETHSKALLDLVQVLRKFVKELGSSKHSANAKMEKYLLLVHYFAVKKKASSAGLLEINAKVSIALLRHIRILPADKMFYLAGVASRETKWLSAAFVYLNRYLDLSEAIDDNADVSNLDNSDFIGTDIPSPVDFPLPETHFIMEESTREEIRDWVLAISMDQQVQEKLVERKCTQCMTSIYEATLQCPECKMTSEACILTGYPVRAKMTVHCTICKAIADKEMWNQWIKQFGNCPWCDAPQKQSY